MKKKIFSSLTLIVSLVVWIMLFELVATYWVARWGDPLDKSKQVLASDGKLGWRQRADFNGKFLGVPLKTNELGLRSKPLGEFSGTSKNIVLLGPSSTFGWGVEESRTYAAMLQKILGKKYPGAKIRVLNAGQIGFSSWQGLHFFKGEGLKDLKIDLLTIAYGVNDVDKFRFFYTSTLPDKEEFRIPKSVLGVSLQNILLKSNFLNLLSRKIFRLFGNFKYFQKEAPVRRVADQDFQENIEALIRMGRARGAEILLLTSAYQLPSVGSSNVEAEKLAENYFNAGKEKYRDKKYFEALAYFSKAVEVKPDQNEAYYYLSCCYSHLGDARKQKEMFEKALRTEPKRIADDIKKLNMLLRDVAQRNNVALADLEGYFILPQDEDVFLDPVHFSVKGHEKVAARLADTIEEHNLLRAAGREG